MQKEKKNTGKTT